MVKVVNDLTILLEKGKVYSAMSVKALGAMSVKALGILKKSVLTS